MPTETPRNSHPHRPDLREHTSFVLTFLPDDSGRTTPDELANLLRQRSVVAAVADGDDLGTPGATVAIIAVDDTGRVLLDADGRVVPGQPVEHLVPGLAHLTGRHVVVDDELVVAPDGSESEPDEDALAARTATTLVAWRASMQSPGLVRHVAHGAGAPVEHVNVDGWTLVALPRGITLDAETFASTLVGASERPVVTLQRAGESRAVTWHHRDRLRAVTVELAAPPATTPIVPEGAPGSSAAMLAEALGDGTLRIVPDTRRLDATTLEALRAVPLERETLLVDVAEILGLPSDVAALVERSGTTTPSGWLDLPGATTLEPDPSQRAVVVRGILDSVLDEPVGDRPYARFRRWFWHRPVALVALALLEALLGVALAASAASGGDVLGHAWPLWTAAAFLVVDGLSDLVAGIVLLRRRRRRRR